MTSDTMESSRGTSAQAGAAASAPSIEARSVEKRAVISAISWRAKKSMERCSR